MSEWENCAQMKTLTGRSTKEEARILPAGAVRDYSKRGRENYGTVGSARACYDCRQDGYPGCGARLGVVWKGGRLDSWGCSERFMGIRLDGGGGETTCVGLHWNGAESVGKLSGKKAWWRNFQSLEDGTAGRCACQHRRRDGRSDGQDRTAGL